ncbi:hypothetical protein M9434_001413 [Picochlorum sp. BPE23]|nr:hypothetical protein M9434_001413 [Picochlorum sp. BPE23]
MSVIVCKFICVLALCLMLSPVHAEDMAGIISEVNTTLSPNDTVAAPMPDGPPTRPRDSLQPTPPSEMVVEVNSTSNASTTATLSGRPRQRVVGLTAPVETPTIVEGANEPSGTDARQQVCTANTWFSSKYGTCYPLSGKCWQYDNTDAETCTNGLDLMDCKWDPYTRYCNPVCGPYEWYSSYYGVCYPLNGKCWQYDNTDAETCTNGLDTMDCKWDPYKGWCDPECKWYEWYSSTYGKCFDKNGKCWQYDNTDAKTCTNSKDNLKCQWDPSTKYCDPVCGPFQWYSSTYGVCYDKNGKCTQYDGTDSYTCITGNDNLVCQWNSSKKWCDPI